jgi:hypothetical protein
VGSRDPQKRVEEVASNGYSEEAFVRLDEILAKNSLDRYVPETLAELRKRAEDDAGRFADSGVEADAGRFESPP